MMRVIVTLGAAFIVTLAFAVGAAGEARANWNKKAQHYCTNWGSAGLFLDDEKLLASNPLEKMKIPLRNGTVLEFPLLYIWKGYELDESPKEWQVIWDGFRQACPGWPKPAWLQKLERWKNHNQPKGDPRIAKRRARIKALLASADNKEARAASDRVRITASPGYRRITGGREDWKLANKTEQDFLRQIVSLKATRYVVVGKVVKKLPQGVWVNGVAINSKASASAPGTRTTAVRYFVQSPKAAWVRSNGDFFAMGVFLLGIPTQQNANVVFGASLPGPTKKAIGQAAKDLKSLTANLKNGEARLRSMLRPVVKLEQEAKSLRLLAQRLQSQTAAKR